ncbi:E3 ubiquitin-protein ligase Os04g0590900-like [Abrus precatorius]|uniref:RING-type E3 ubiquitin transferase n=1 Tax=Abrus precatorius TaxID=3816 RepID=A0A8B8LXN5_ABRPR|nr:E3 ubiquitin-protein ligase Os04g0590900-like [Abrus precatorius]
MASLGNPRSWVPYMNNKDCSQGFCSLYCPQWCYAIYSPPPPPFEFPYDDSSPNLSPLVIAVIGVLASAFLLVSYYTIISKYCGSREFSQSENLEVNVEFEEDHNPSLHEPWQASTIGLDEALIKSITVCKYKKGDGLVEVTDCPVCLSEFQDDESVRLLPKCSHAFHLPCIDTWLKSHSSCPLCRASIFTFNATNATLHVPATLMELPSRNETSSENQHADENIADARELDAVEEEIAPGRAVPKTAFALRALSDLGNLRGRNSIIEIRDDDYDSVRRSVSMDHSFQNVLSVSDVLHMNHEQEGSSTGVGTSKGSRGESSKSSYKRRVLHCVLSPIAMKRSFSSGRFSLSGNGRGRHGILPV